MSYRLLGSVRSNALQLGGFGANTFGCCCGCHTRSFTKVLSSKETWSQRSRKYSLSHNHHRSPLLRCDMHRLKLHSSLYKSKYLLPSSTSQFLHRNHDLHCSNLDIVGVCALSAVFSNYFPASSFHTYRVLLKDESKVEKAVKALKEKVESEKGTVEEKPAEPKIVLIPTPAEPAAAVVPAKKTIGERVVAELKHYYHGFRLLFIDMKICIRLLYNVANGKSLTRRERRQLVRTTADMFRLVPFLVFVLVPFMEFLLPVFIKLFPNMLPSTFAEENKEQEKLKKNLKVKLEMAKFLQETIHETALQAKKKKGGAVEEFSQFVDKIRKEGTRPTTKEIMKFAKLFEDEITLDNLSRQQLRAVCRVLGVQPIGIDALLRFQLDMKLRQLKADDKMIVKEGIDSLNYTELQVANRARGMRALGVSDERLKAQLQQWLTLHLEKNIPTSLLLLSRALYLPDNLSAEEQIEATLTELTQKAPSTADEAKLKAAELAGEDVDNKTRLEIIKKEETIIAAEAVDRKQEQKVAAEEEKARQVQQEREAAEAAAAQSAMDSKDLLRDDALILDVTKTEELKDTAPRVTGLPDEKLVEGEEEKITAKDLEDIESALEEIAEHKQLNIEREELQDLKEEVNEYKEDLMDLKEVIVLSGAEHDEIVESKAAKRLIKRVDKLIYQADAVMMELQKEKEKFQEALEARQEEIELREVRLKRSSELKADEKKVEEVMQQISDKKDNIVSINEMLLAMKRLQKVPNETKLQRIMEVLDEDKDGNININLALKVLEVLGRENVKLDKTQVTEMLNLLKREHALEEEERQRLKKEKEQKPTDEAKPTEEQAQASEQKEEEAKKGEAK